MAIAAEVIEQLVSGGKVARRRGPRLRQFGRVAQLLFGGGPSPGFEEGVLHDPEGEGLQVIVPVGVALHFLQQHVKGFGEAIVEYIERKGAVVLSDVVAGSSVQLAVKARQHLRILALQTLQQGVVARVGLGDHVAVGYLI